MRRFLNLFAVAVLSGATTLGGYKLFVEKDAPFKDGIVTSAPAASYARPVGLTGELLDFTAAADKAVHFVVHVKNVSYRTVHNPLMEFFYGYRGGQQQEQIGTGSGVIISEDGYIVTNNHVIKDAQDIEITLNNRKVYKAKLIGTDSKMDIALLKIDADEKLPYTTFADSDNIKVGDWVLAVGNPYNLNSTVTAGIVSAKARDLQSNGLQSFIQTDAAVNPGNSGGALVNTNGELIGINTMISSMTGAYVGYSFAVPSNITRKIVEDIMEYGNVQRGILGIEGGELTPKVSQDLGLKQNFGFYVKKVNKGTGAEKSGLKEGDIIVKIDNRDVYTFSDLASFINTKRPNDEVKVTFIREGEKKTVPVKLTKYEFSKTEFKGLELENLSAADKKKFRTNFGVKITDITNDRYQAYHDELIGNVIVSIDNIKATDIETVQKILNSKDENATVRIEMINKEGQLIRVIL